MPNLNDVTARAIREAPVSIRELARRAGVSHVLLLGLLSGTRNATPAVARALAAALEGVAAEAARGAGRVRRHLSKGGK